MLGTGAPLEPSREEARRWAVEELSKRAYQEHRPGLVQRAMNWVLERLSDVPVPTGTGSALLFTVLAGVVAVLIFLAVRRVGLVGRRARAVQRPVLADVTETPQELRDQAERHAAGQDWAAAVAARFRAVARELERTGDVRVSPGMTATELAAAGGAARPSLAGDLRSAARLFDEAVYGHHPVTRADYERLVALDAAVAAARAGAARGTGAQ